MNDPSPKSIVVVTAALLPLLLAASGCGGKKPPKGPSNAGVDGAATTSSEHGSDSGNGASGGSGGEGGGGGGGDEGKPKGASCSGGDVDLMGALIQSACEVPNAKAGDKPVDVKGRLDVKVATGSAKVAPGGKVDVVVTFTNKGKDPLPLDFILDPTPRFVIEAYNEKGTKRVDMPPGNPPPPPKGESEAAPATQGTARVTLTPNGVARVRLSWDAHKTRWAPEKFKGTPPEMGYPRSPAGPLPKGRYMLRVVTPLTNVAEGGEHDVSAPKAFVEVGS